MIITLFKLKYNEAYGLSGYHRNFVEFDLDCIHFWGVLIYLLRDFITQHRKRKWAVVSGSETQLHVGFIVSRKLCLNLCLFRWLKFSLKRMSNLMSLLSWISKTEFLEVLTKLSNAFLNNIGKGNDFIPSLKLFHYWEQRGKNVLLKLTVLEAVYFKIFFAVNLVW